MTATPPPPLVFRDLKAKWDGKYLQLDDHDQRVVYDEAEAIALKNWLNEVLP
jgi:hypothetical protein